MLTTNGKVRILGVDPGAKHIGLTVVEMDQEGHSTWITSQVVKPDKVEPSLFLQFRLEHDASVMGIEIPEGRNGPAVKFIPPTAEIAGAAWMAGKVYGLTTVRLTAREWRKHIVGKGNASDAEIALALADHMELPTRSNAHSRDAAGVAIVAGWMTYLGRIPTERMD